MVTGLQSFIFALASGTTFLEWSRSVDPARAAGQFAARSLGYDGKTLGGALGSDGESLSDPALAGLDIANVGLSLSGHIRLEAGTYTFVSQGRAGAEGLSIKLGGVDVLDGGRRGTVTIPEDALLPIEVLSVGGGAVRVLEHTPSGRLPLSIADLLHPSAESYFGYTPAESEVSGGLRYVPLASASDAPVMFEVAAENDVFWFASAADPAKDTFSFDDAQALRTPDAGSASVSLAGTVADGAGEMEAMFAAAATPANGAPVARDNLGFTFAGTPVLIGALRGDSDPDGDRLALVSVTDPDGGRVVVENGRVRYTPDRGFVGTDEFSYTISDGRGGTDTASVIVEVMPREPADPTPPTGERGFAAEYFRLPSSVSSLSGVNFDRTPDATGTVGQLGRASGNSPFWDGGPADRFAARYTATLEVERAGAYRFFLTSDDGAALFINGQRVINNDGLHGAIERRGIVDLAAGNYEIEVIYFDNQGRQTLILDWVGPDTDGVRTRLSRDALAPLPEPNEAPVATDDAASVDEGRSVRIDVLANDSDPDGDALAITNVSAAANGSVRIEGGAIRYTPTAGFSGTDRFTYTIADGNGGVDRATVTVAVTPNAAPGLAAEYHRLTGEILRLADINFARTPDATGTVASLNRPVSTNPFWAGGPTDVFAARFTGDLNVTRGGSYTFYLTSDDGSALWIDGQRVILHDGLHASTEQSVTLNLTAGAHSIELRYFEYYADQSLVLEWSGPDSGGRRAVISGAAFSHDDDGTEPANRPPVAAVDAATTREGRPVLVDVLANDRDPDGDPLEIAWVADPTNGTATIVNGEVRYTPDAGFTGVERFNYAVRDDNGAVTEARVTITVEAEPGPGPVNTAPDAVNDTVTGTVDSGMLHVMPSAILANDRDADGDAISIVSLTGATMHNGMIMVTSPVSNGQASFSYTISDGRGGTDTANVTVRVPTPPDDDGLPRTPAQIEAFVAAERAKPEAHAHGDDPAMAREHMQVMDLVSRADATHIAIANGDWSDPGTWYQGRVPGEGARVLIPEAASVTYDMDSDVSLFTVRVDGELSFSREADTSMLVDTLVVSSTGRLEMGTAENPMPAGINAEIVIANNGNINVNWDPGLFSRGVISHGEVEIHGTEKTSFVKVDAAPMAGARSIVLDEIPEGWQVGDTIVITGTHKEGWTWDNAAGRVVHVESQDEEVTITGINGNRLTIDRPLQYNHDAPRADLAAYVANMSRNVTFRSEDGDSTNVHHRGHVMLMHSDEIDVRYAAFDDLGRTDKSEAAADASSFSRIAWDSNVKGRYGLHLHKTGTEDRADPAFVVGNALSGSPGWGFAQHSSHAVFVDNAAYDVFGAHFAAEDGDETGVWARNIAIKGEGIGYGEASVKQQEDLPRHDNGRTGDGFFFAGRLVEAVQNVAANTTNGYVWMHRSAPANPLSQNLDHPEVAYGSPRMRLDQAPIQGFRDNEAFGTQTGLIVVKADARQEHDVRTVLDGFLNWETSEGMDITYTSHYTIRDVDLIGTRNTRPVADAEFGFRVGGNTYDLTVNGIEIEGFRTGITTINLFTFPVTDAEARTHIIDPVMRDVDTPYSNFSAARLRILDSDDLQAGRLTFDMQGDTTLSPGETLFFNGLKTDSLGTRSRQSDSMDDIQRAEWNEHIVPMLRRDGYYDTPDGRNVMIVEDFVADRATGALLKIGHVVTLQMTDAQLRGLGATSNGVMTPGGPAPVARNDTFIMTDDEPLVLNVLRNDSDPDGGPLQLAGMTQPTLGGVIALPNDTILYIPGVDVEGTDTFTYWAGDGEGNFTRATVTIELFDGV
jgi:hypothetical protein